MNAPTPPPLPPDRAAAAAVADARAELAAALGREAEARQRAAELAKANRALARTAERMIEQPDLQAFLGHVTSEAALQLDAEAAHLIVYDEGSETLRTMALIQDGVAVPIDPLAAEVPASAAGFFRVQRETRQPRYFDPAREADLFWPGAVDYLRAKGLPTVFVIPICAGGHILGVLGLAFRRVLPITEDQSELVVALANQAALAIQMTRLADEAKQAAVAREREQAAQERAAQLARANTALSRSLDGLVGHGQLETFLDSVLREATTASGAVSGAVFVHEKADDTLRVTAMILRGETLDIAHDPRAAAFKQPVPAATGLVWPVLKLQHEVFWLDYSEPDPRDWPQSYAWHQEHGHRFVACIPMLLVGEAVGFLGLAFDKNEIVQPTETRLELCRVLAQQATLALHLTRLAQSARESAVAREREAAAQVRAAELARVNEALRGGVARLVEAPDIASILDVWLLEAMRLTGATGGAVLRRVGKVGTEFAFATMAQGDAIMRENLSSEFVATLGEVSRRDPAGVFMRMVRGEFVSIYTRELDEWYPLAAAYHRRAGNGITWNMPFRVSGEVAGYLGLAFPHEREPDTVTLRTLEALALQSGMAMELRQKSQEARQVAVAREREAAAQERAAELARTNAAVGDSLNELIELTDLRAFLRHVFGQCARLSGALGGGLFFHDAETDMLRKQLGWIKGEVVDFSSAAGAAFWQEPLPAATIPDWAESVQIAAGSKRIWKNARPWHRAQGYGWLSRVPLKAGAQAFGFLGMAFARREDLSAEKAELICAMSHQIALAVQLDRLARSSEQAAVAREQERAVREQASELAKANGVLRRGVEQLSNPHSIRDILDQFLFEAVGIAGAAAGAVLQRVGEGTEFVLRSLTQDGAVVRDFGLFTDEPAYRRATGGDLDGIMRRTANGESFYFPVAGMERWFPEVMEYHRAHGHRTIGHFPFGVGGEVTGYLALAFREDGPPGTVPTETVRTLALQASLALETQRLADEAKEAAILAERNRIARDLHDVLAQGFVGVLTQVGVLEGSLEADDHEEIARVTQRVRAIAREGLEEARRSVHSLRPLGQADRLFERLRAILAGLTAGTGLHAQATQTGTSAALSELADWAAVKFVQQALTNTLRYADAAAFALALAWEETGLTLTARDDGAGFDPAAPRTGIGLRAMAERAAECGGTFHVESSADVGTTLRLFLPTPPEPPPSSP